MPLAASSDKNQATATDSIAEAETAAAAMQTEDSPHGQLGPKFNRGSPFFFGMIATAGVATTYAAVHVVLAAGSVLMLIAGSFFLALGLEPAVSWLVAHRLPRWLATTTVFLVVLAVIAAFVAAAIPPLSQQASQLIDQAPHYIQQAQSHSSTIGKLNDRFHIQQRIAETVNGSGTSMLNGVVTASSVVFGALADTLIVVVLTVYLLADFPRIRATLYRLAPQSRRPRVILIGDDVFTKVGAYVLGNLVISVIAGTATAVWLAAFGVPYPLLLGIFVALLDLVPVVGSTIAGIVVCAVALTVSLPVCITTAAFFVVFRLAEDYLLVPRIIGRVVEVPALVTVIAVLVGAALLGVFGALIAIPLAAALQLIAQEVLFPRLDTS
ncbi:AI-2E family transporter [Mycobacteroides franklinii]|uniref:AI-2E family transporter n=1 Tax=Mycobacteroides franklinii TaxID=948102 RepID=A0A1S1L6M1_9MYCO|nr:AI-2E family transporter [Mycobacteroides franklinii]